MTAKASAPVHSFSTNFFGVLGYVGSTLVWLVVLASCALLFPSSVEEQTRAVITTPLAEVSQLTDFTDKSTPMPAMLGFFLAILLIIVFWAFAYIASRLLSRVVRRLAHLVSRRVGGDAFFRTKYAIHAVGLICLTLVIAVTPIDLSTKSAIAILGFTGGILGMVAIALQQRLAKRHHVPLTHIL